MTENTQDHTITMSLVQAPHAEVAAGVDVVLKIRVACLAGCDLRGNTGRVVTQDDEVIREFYLNQFFGTNETDALILKAPVDPGEYTWTVVFPEQEKDSVIHEEASTSCTFTVMEHHKTSIAIWDVDSPVVISAPLKLKVGVRCSANCQLTGKEIEVYDQQSALVTTGRLGEDPWPGTTALYWTELELAAPDAEGIYNWSVRFPDPNEGIPHLESCSPFGFKVVDPPNCTLTVEVTEQESGLPISNADVIVHPYRGRADENGIARFELVEGEYQMYVTRVKYDTLKTTIKAFGNLTISAKLTLTPVPDFDQG